MTSNTDRNDLMPPQVFKLEWVTPKISLMVAEDTVLWRIGGTLLTDFNIKPRHTYKNQSSQRVYKDPFLVCSGHLRHWLPGTVAADFGLGGRVKDATDVLLASR